jgi:hypothetical protein
MPVKKFILPILILALILPGCSGINGLWNYYNTTNDFTSLLNKKDYDRCIYLFDRELLESEQYPKDTLIDRMKLVNKTIADNFGTVKYSSPWVVSNYSFTSSNGANRSVPRATVSFDNGKEFGIMDITFDSRSQKITSFYLRDFKKPIPDESLFWVFMVFGIINAAFIIYVIVLIKRSGSKHKKRKYALAIMLNLPTLSYSALAGISFHLFNIQLFLGSGYSKTGYLDATWDLAFPLGALLVINKLKKENRIADGELEQQLLEQKWAEEQRIREEQESNAQSVFEDIPKATDISPYDAP